MEVCEKGVAGGADSLRLSWFQHVSAIEDPKP